VESKSLRLKNTPKVIEMNCSVSNCDEYKTYLEKKFFDDLVMELDLHRYDLPSATRMLLGFLDYLEEFNTRQYDTLHILGLDESLALFFNCKAASVEEALATPV
jgi:hypothetical protein